MKNPLTVFKNRPERDKRDQTKNPWLLETVRNGLKATNIKESSAGIRENKRISVQYFEFDRIYGHHAFDSALKVTELFSELQNITPRTKGYIFGEHKYVYHGNGILKINHSTAEEEYFSDDTLRNQSVACYFPGIVYSQEEDQIQSMITELNDATSGHTTDHDIRRISHEDSEQ